MLALTVLRLPEANKWDRVELAKIAATPWDLHRPRETEVVFKEVRAEQPEELEGKIALARQPYIKSSDLVEFGMTRGCPKCDHMIENGPNRSSKPHSTQRLQRWKPAY